MNTTTSSLVVVSNRGPQRWVEDRWAPSSGGLVTALDPVLRERGGVWVSAAESNQAPDPPDLGYTQALVRLPDAVREGFYTSVANGVLWPAMHGFPTIAEIADAPWHHYEAANQAFANGVLDVVSDNELVWLHDYHLMTAPGLLREQRPNLRIGWFNHIPWPDADHFAVLPWRRQIIESYKIDGLLGADIIGFHTSRYAAHFFDCAERLGDADIDRERGTIAMPHGSARVVAAPIGIPTRAIAALVTSPAVVEREAAIRRAVDGRRIILGVDRLDYTKGIPERLGAYTRMLEQKPELLDQVVLVQVMIPSREDVPAYANLKSEIDRLVGQLNGRFGVTGRAAVHYMYRAIELVDLYAHYRAADVGLVTPLRDGMNLVALEYVASRTTGDGALVLSEFAGAAERLQEAYVVNPHDVDAVATQLDRALHDPIEERRRRMSALRKTVESLDVELWARSFLHQLLEARATGPTGPLPQGPRRPARF